MAERVSSTGLPITWEWCKRHDWKSEKVVCPFCRAERLERERDEARPVLEAARQQAKAAENLGTPVSLEFKCEAKDDWLITAYRTEQRIEEYDAARASAEDKP